MARGLMNFLSRQDPPEYGFAGRALGCGNGSVSHPTLSARLPGCVPPRRWGLVPPPQGCTLRLTFDAGSWHHLEARGWMDGCADTQPMHLMILFHPTLSACFLFARQQQFFQGALYGWMDGWMDASNSNQKKIQTKKISNTKQSVNDSYAV